MSIPVIDTLTALGNYPVVKSENVDMSGDSIDVVINKKTDKTYVDSQINEINSKFNGYAKKSDIPKNISEFTNDAGYITAVPDSSISIDKLTDQTKLYTVKDYVTPQMFGAVGNGVTDDTTAFISAVTYVRNKFKNDKVLYSLGIPAGTYLISSTIVLPNFLKLVTLGTVYINSTVENAATFEIRVIDSPITSVHHFVYYSGDCFDCSNGGMTIYCSATNKIGTIGLKLGNNARDYDADNKSVMAWKSFSHISFVAFDTAIMIHSVDNYLNKFRNLKFAFNNVAVAFKRAGTIVNSGELFNFDNCVFGDCEDVAITTDWTGNDIIECVFNGCSFDFCYNGVVKTAGVVFFRFIGCHIEGIGEIYSKPINTSAYLVKSSMLRTDISSMFIFDSTDFMSYTCKLFKSEAKNMHIALNNVFFRDLAQAKKKVINVLSDDDVTVKYNNIIKFTEYNPIISNSINQIKNYAFQESELGAVAEHTQLGDVLVDVFLGYCEIVEESIDEKLTKALKYTNPDGSETVGNYIVLKSNNIPCRPNDKINPNILVKANIASIPRIANIKFYDVDGNQLAYEPSIDVSITDSAIVNVNTWTMTQRVADWIAPSRTSYFNVEWIINPRSNCDIRVTNVYVDIT